MLSRNPFYPTQITKYLLNPEVIDMLVFCTKNPFPMLDRLSLLSAFDMFWFVTITPYGKEIERNGQAGAMTPFLLQVNILSIII